MKRGSNRISWTTRGRGRSISNSALTVPGPAVMTTTLSASAMASSRSWVTKMTAGLVWSHRSSSSSDMIARVCTSRALNGSSMSRIRGWLMRRLRERDPLAHAAGQLVGVAVLEAGQPDAAQPVPGRLSASARPAPR